MIKTSAVDINIQAISPVLKCGSGPFLKSTDGKRNVKTKIKAISANGKYLFMQFLVSIKINSVKQVYMTVKLIKKLNI